MPTQGQNAPAWPGDLDGRLRRLADAPSPDRAERARAALAAMRQASAERERQRAELEPPPPDRRTPVDQLRHWSEYETVGDWYGAFGGYVPTAVARGVSDRMRERGLTFREAYAQVCVREGRLVSVHAGDEPPCRVCELLHTPAPGAG